MAHLPVQSTYVYFIYSIWFCMLMPFSSKLVGTSYNQHRNQILGHWHISIHSLSYLSSLTNHLLAGSVLEWIETIKHSSFQFAQKWWTPYFTANLYNQTIVINHQMLGYPEFTTKTTVPRTHKCDRPWFNLGSYRSFVFFVSPICWFLCVSNVFDSQGVVLCFDHDSHHL